jgi:cytochrome c-type biogenesis protein CcmH/NrfG
MNKTLVIVLSSVLIASYAGFFIYQKVQKKKTEKALESATKEAVEKFEVEQKISKVRTALTDSYGQPKIFTF